MKVRYLFVNKLENYREHVSEHLEDYKNGKLTFVRASDIALDTKIKVDDVDLYTASENASDTDFENIKRFYTAFKNLSDGQATEEVLWAGLCHHKPFSDYLQYRWSCETEQDVLRRYFFNDAARSIIMNGLARLWWYGRMTYDENSQNPFELTEYICKENLTLKGFLPLTFGFSNNKRLYRVYLKALMIFEREHKLHQYEHEKIRRRVSAWGGTILLDSLSDDELHKKIFDYLRQLVLQRD
jgi:hypothetical protein